MPLSGLMPSQCTLAVFSASRVRAPHSWKVFTLTEILISSALCWVANGASQQATLGSWQKDVVIDC